MMRAVTAEGPIVHTASRTDESSRSRSAQQQWADLPIRSRLRVLGRARTLMAERSAAFCKSYPAHLARTQADTLVAELLPLLEAMRFLEKNAEQILRPRALGRRGLPWWMGSLRTHVERVPLGQVLILGPANYPLFLPGVQAMQALAAGNTVVWKPGTGGSAVAELVAATLVEAGLPAGVLTITADTAAAGEEAIAGCITGTPPDKVILTGSAETGRRVMSRLAETGTPLVAELAGCDAVIVLPSADMARVVQALSFGMRLNGSATCMAPRRLFLVGFPSALREQLLASLRTAFSNVASAALDAHTAARLSALVADALDRGASASVPVTEAMSSDDRSAKPVLLAGVSPEMLVGRTDVFAPLLSVMDAADEDALLAAESQCPYALTAAVFGDEQHALRLSRRLTAGTVLINDIIVPTADPRVPFGGRRKSGFGSTRGTEGLLEMTAPRVVIVRKDRGVRHYAQTGQEHVAFFEAMILASHAADWRQRLRGLRSLFRAGRTLREIEVPGEEKHE